MLKTLFMISECGKDRGMRGGTISHSTGDESNTIKVSYIKILFRGAF